MQSSTLRCIVDKISTICHGLLFKVSVYNAFIASGQAKFFFNKWCGITEPPVSPVITNESIAIVSGDSHGIAIGLEWTSSGATIVDSYVINVSPPTASVSTFITANTSIQLFVLYNQEYNISVLATNCAGNSTPTETNFKIGKMHALIELVTHLINFC